MKGLKWVSFGCILALVLIQVLVSSAVAADIVNTTDIGTELVPAAGDGINEAGDNNITNNADIYVEEVGIATESGTITNNEVVSSEYNVAILFDGTADDTFTNSSTGSIVVVNSATMGIDMGSGSDDLVNAGSIEIIYANTFGIDMGSGDVGDDTLTNTGSIEISETETTAIAFHDGDDLLDNSGSIIVDAVLNNGGGITMGAGTDTVINSGLILVRSADYAGMSFGDGDDTLTNSGTLVLGDVGYGAAMSFADGDDTLTNSGTLQIDSASCAGISFASGDDTFTNSGTVQIGTTGNSAISMGDNDDTFVNSGSITIEDAGAGGIVMGDGYDSFDNSGTIWIDETYYGAINLGGEEAGTFTNSGDITILFAGEGGINVGGDMYNSSTFTNSGTIDIALTCYKAIGMGSGDDTFTNTGTIDVQQTCSGPGITLGSGDDTLTNSGTILLGAINSAGISLGGDDDTVTNDGTIQITSTGSAGLSFGSGDDTFTNNDTLTILSSGTSGISMGQDDDILVNNGTIDIGYVDSAGISMGEDDDTLTNNLGATISVDHSNYYGINMCTGDDTLTNAGTIDIGLVNSTGINFYQGVTNTLDNSGDINIDVVFEGDGIYMEGDTSDYNSANLLTNSGSIDIGSTSCSGIYQEDASNSIDNSGSLTIDVTEYYGIHQEVYSSNDDATNTLINSGTIDMGLVNNAAVYMEYGGTQTFTNSGDFTVLNVGDDSAIYMEAESSNYNSANLLTNTGTIDIGFVCSNGIYMEDGDNTLDNSGSIVIDYALDDGIYLYGYSSDDDQTNQIINSGTIDIGFANSNAIEIYYGTENVIDNQLGGVITIGASGDYDAIRMEANSSYNSTNLLRNAGTIDIGYACNGVEMEYATVSNTFENSGTFNLDSTLGFGVNLDITGSEEGSENNLINSGTMTIGFVNSHAFELEDAQFNTIDNSGTITIGDAGYYNVFNMEGNTSYNSVNLFTNSGTIDVGFACNGLEMESASNVFDNSGTFSLESTLGFGIQMDAYQTEDTNTFTNSGTIDIGFANSNGIELDGGFTNSLDNSGTITIVSGDYNGIYMYGQNTNYNSVNLLTNSGTIDIGYGCNGIAMEYSDNTLNNSGTITIDGANDDAIYMYGYSSDPKSDQSLINSGTLDIVYANGAGIYMYYGQDNLIDNSGTLSIDQVKGSGIEMYAYNSATLTNSGTISIGYSNSNAIEVDGNDGTVGNLTNTGTITVNNVMDNGIDISTDLEAVLTNSGTITIGAANSNGIEIYANDTDSKAEFYNLEGGTITVGTTYYQYLEMYGYDNTFDNAGTINFTTFADEEGIVINSYNSAIFSNSGTLNIVNAQAEGIEFGSGGDVTFTNSGVITIDTNMDDHGILFSSGDDTLTNTGTINILRTSTGIEMGLGDDTLTTSGALNFVDVNDEVLDGGSGHDILNLQGTDALGIEGDIDNFEDLYKSGAGSWTLNGDVEAYNSVVVSEGTLIVNGDLDNNYADGVSVASGATFGGDMVVYGDVMVGGTITPGNSIGTVHVDGADYYQADGATYEVEVGSFEESDLILVTGDEGGGTAYLDDGALVNVTSVGYVADGDIFTILQADTLDSFYNAAGLSYSSIVLDYEYVDDEDDTVKLAATRTPYEELVSSNAAGAGSALIALAANGDLDAAAALGQADNSDNTDDLEDGLGSLAPEMYPELLDFSSRELHTTALMGYMTNMHVASNFKSQADVASNKVTAAGPALSRMAAFDDRAAGISGWARLIGTSGSQDNDGDLQGYDFDTYGLSIGFDNKVSSNLLLGVGFGMANSDVDFDDYSQSSDVEGYFGSFYGSYATGNIYVDAALSYASNDFDSDRYVALADAKASSSTDGTELGLYVGGGLTMVDTETMYFVPTASLSWATVDIDGFTESGAEPFSLDVDDYDADSLVATLGFRWGGKMGMMEPELRLAWAHEFGDTDRDVTARFDGTTTTFTIDGVEPDEDSALIGLGADFFIGESMTLYLDYDGEFRSDFDAHSLSGGLRYNF